MSYTLSWIDLPVDDYTLVLGYQSKDVQTLNQLINSYHDLPKGSEEAIEPRIEILQQVIAHLEGWLQERLTGVEKVKHLKWVQEIAANKCHYLQKLKKLYSTQQHTEEQLYNYHHDVAELTDPSYEPVILNSQCFFSLKMREYWGDFWLESIDPCHRRLTPFYRQWLRAKEQKQTTHPFFLWLETQERPRYVPTVRYLTDAEKTGAAVHVSNGLVYHHNQPANWNEPNERYLFGIDLKKNIFVAREGEGCSHSSFTHGKPVLGAGLFKATNGQLTSIALESGHYLPSVEVGYQIIRILQEKQVDWPAELEVVYFHDRNKYTARIAANQLCDLSTFSLAIEQSRGAPCTAV